MLMSHEDQKSLEDRVLKEINAYFAHDGIDGPPLTLSTPLEAYTGMDSVDWLDCLIALEIKLNLELDRDSFRVAGSTVADLVELVRRGTMREAR